MITMITLIISLYFSVSVIRALIICTWEEFDNPSENIALTLITMLTCILWGYFYYLTH